MYPRDDRPLHLDAGLLVLRLMLAAVFLFHGSQKVFGAFGGPGIEGFTGYLAHLGVPFPALNAWLAALAELVGGFSLLTGLGLRLLLVPLTVTMLVASFVAHGGAFSAQAGGMEYSLTLAVANLALFLTGSGSYALTLPVQESAPEPLPQAAGA